MANSTAYESSKVPEELQIWENLKEAIATSSGFQRWQIEHPVDEHGQGSTVTRQEANLDYRVSRYLRETLETLAY